MAPALHTRSTGALVTQISQRSCHRASPCAPNLARSLQRQHGGPRRRAGQDLSSKAAASAASPAQQPAPSSNSRWRSSLPRVLLCVALLSLLALVFRCQIAMPCSASARHASEMRCDTGQPLLWQRPQPLAQAEVWHCPSRGCSCSQPGMQPQKPCRRAGLRAAPGQAPAGRH